MDDSDSDECQKTEQPPRKKFAPSKTEDLSPSRIKWNDLVKNGVVLENLEHFFVTCEKQRRQLIELEVSAEYLYLIDTHKLLVKKGFHSNEAFCLLVYGNIMGGVADILSDHESEYKFGVLPIIYRHDKDGKKNKFADFILMKVESHYPRIIIELKRTVSYDLYGIEEQHLAQLLQEVYLSKAEHKAIAVYGCHTHCYVFVLKLNELRCLSVLEYYFVPSAAMEKLYLVPFLVIHQLARQRTEPGAECPD